MSFNLSINFDTFEDLQTFMIEFNRFKKIQDKKINKKVDELASNCFIEKEDKRGKHQQEYHNLAKIHQSEHPELSYRQALKIVYKNNKTIEKSI
jgi:hypothetical protein